MGRPVEDLASRFERQVDRDGDHHVWLGRTNPERGTGRINVNKVEMTAHRVAWELTHGPLPQKARVLACTQNPACVRLDHLRLEAPAEVSAIRRTRARKGTGSMREIRPGTWELRATVGRWEDGRPRTLNRSVSAGGETEAAAQLVSFVEELRDAHHADSRDVRDITVDEAMERFLTDYLAGEKGRADKTVTDYRYLHQRWFSPTIGSRPVKGIDSFVMDDLFGKMRKAGLSASRLTQAKSLYVPFFRWAKRRGMGLRNPMADFEMPTSTYRSKERTPPEVEELCLLLSTAMEVTPEIAPLLALGAVTGTRRGELVAIPRSSVAWKKNQITVDTAISSSGKVKATKTRRGRTFHVDAETIAMLKRDCSSMDERAQAAGVELAADPFLFSLTADCSKPMPPDFFTKRVGVLKEYLGIENKRPEVVALEDKALRLRMSPPGPRPRGRTGPSPDGGMSFRDVGRQLNRSERWASLAIAAAQRRSDAKASGFSHLDFDGSILALRKFTSSELLDAGFNVSMVAQRQGHGPQVLTRHYSKSRASSDKKAAEHLGRIVHGNDV
jgi:integrase